jgi:hypothetical protein
LESLSAYLDGQLSPRHIRKLESRLKREPALQQALEDLHRTRRLLRSASQVRSPRNFTLTPEMAGKQVTFPRGYTAVRVVAVAASLMFAVVFTGDFLLSSSRLLPGAAPAPAAEPAMELYSMQDVGDEAKVEAVEEAEAPLAMEAPEADTSQERVVETEGEVIVEEAPAEQEDLDATAPKAAPEDAVGGGAPEEGTTALEMPGTPTMMGTPMPPEATQAPTEPPLLAPEATEAPAVDATIEPEPAEIIIEPTEEGLVEREEAAGEAEAPVEMPERKAPIPVIRFVEGGLILIAILSGGLALFMRRRMS